MFTYECSYGTVDYSVGLWSQLKEELTGSGVSLEDIFKVSLIGVSFVFQRAGINVRNIRMLEAHGNSDNGFVYEDEAGTFRFVEEWIRRYEEKHDGLVIGACNTRGVRLEPGRSHIMYPLGLFSTEDYLFNHATLVMVPRRD